MEKIIINTADSFSEIHVGTAWETVHEMLPHSGVAILTDTNVMELYGDRFPDFPVLRITPGEESKKLEVVEMLAAKLMKAGIDRDGFILGIGGGVVCDLAGFLASIYMRESDVPMFQHPCCRRWMPAQEERTGLIWKTPRMLSVVSNSLSL
ncbi:MAG: hypothetical protein IPI69_06650 [Bacteroidales bacterium]|nr:hypothetical protein [Bacteroidales bacterium]